MRYLVTIADQSVELDVERHADGTYRVRREGGAELEVTPLARSSGLLTLLVAGQAIEVQPGESEVRFRGQRYGARADNALERAQQRSASVAGAGHLLASMPGRIVRVLCEVGQAVSAGTPLIVIEAMKMQNELCAKTDTVVRAVLVTVGQTVERGSTLVELD